MATTKIWKITTRIDKAIKYITNKEKTSNSESMYTELHNVIEYTKASYKTEEELYVSGINCTPETAKEEMIITKKSFGKTNGIVAFHAFQSFVEKEVTPKEAHEIGIRLAEEIWGDRFEVLVCTHLNTNHLHNHFLLNSVSFVDGKKYYDNRKNYALLRETSDMLCNEYNLSVLKEKPCPKSKINYENYIKSKFQNSSYYITTKEDIDRAIGQAYSYEDFESIMKAMDYILTYRAQKLSVCRKPYKRNIRIERTYGDEYTLDNIKHKIMEIKTPRVPFQEAYSRVYKRRSDNYTSLKNKSKRSGIYRLYMYYCYRLKMYPQRKIKTPMSEELRAEVKKLDEISREIRFLDSKNIKTIEDLFLYKEALCMEIDNLKDDREKLYYKSKTTVNKDDKASIRVKSMQITEQINFLRREVRICESAEKRTLNIAQNIEKMDSKNIREKESEKNERIK